MTYKLLSQLSSYQSADEMLKRLMSEYRSASPEKRVELFAELAGEIVAQRLLSEALRIKEAAS